MEDRESTPAEGEAQSEEVEGHSLSAEEREALNADDVEGHGFNVESVNIE